MESRWGRWIVVLTCFPLGLSMLFISYPFAVADVFENWYDLAEEEKISSMKELEEGWGSG